MAKKNSIESARLIDAALRSNLQKQDWEKLGGNIVVGLQFGASKSLRKKAAISLGDHYADRKDYSRAFAAYENARCDSQAQLGIITKELGLLDGFVSEYMDEFSIDDLTSLEGLVKILMNPIRQFPDKIIEIDLPKKIWKKKKAAPEKKETKFSFTIAQFFNWIDPNLTPEQRWEKVAKILAPAVLRTIEDQRKRIGVETPKPKPADKPKPPKKPKK